MPAADPTESQPPAEHPPGAVNDNTAPDSAADVWTEPASSAESSAQNPYAPPRSAIPEMQRPIGRHLNLPLASRWKRLGGSILDGLIYVLAMMPGFVITIFLENGPEELLIAAMVFMFASLGAVAVYNWYLITVSGQSIAKRILGMRIVSTQGELPGFLLGVFVRQWIPLLINQFCNLFYFVDVLFIFGPEKRCLHDHMASTIVIDTEIERRRRSSLHRTYPKPFPTAPPPSRTPTAFQDPEQR